MKKTAILCSKKSNQEYMLSFPPLPEFPPRPPAPAPPPGAPPIIDPKDSAIRRLENKCTNQYSPPTRGWKVKTHISGSCIREAISGIPPPPCIDSIIRRIELRNHIILISLVNIHRKNRSVLTRYPSFFRVHHSPSFVGPYP